jgi:hypothetical protein
MAQHWGNGSRQSPSGDRRLAEEFDLALSGTTGSGTASRRNSAAPAPAAQVTALVTVARRVEQTGAALPGMDDAFRAQLRERLVRLTPELVAAPSRPRTQVPGQRGGRHAGLRRPVSTRPAHTGI